MEFETFKKNINEAKQKLDENKKKYDILSMMTTIIAVLSPILIAQTDLFWLRLTGAALLILNHFISGKMDEYFRHWLGNKRRLQFLRLEYFEFKAGIDHYSGLNQKEKKSMVSQQLDSISQESQDFMDVMDLDPKKLKENIKEDSEKINTIVSDLKEFVKKCDETYPDSSTQIKFSYFINSRYLDQLKWFFKRINPNKDELKESDIEKSVYFNLIKNSKISLIFKIMSIVLTVFTFIPLLELFGGIDAKVTSIIIVLIATICSIISSIYSEMDKVQKNGENTLHYLQTVKLLTRLYEKVYPTLKEHQNSLSTLNELETGFVSKCESVLLQESVKWTEIQHSKSD